MLVDRIATLALYLNTPVPLASAMSISEGIEVLSCQVFTDHVKGLEARDKIQQFLFGRLDQIIKGLSSLGRLLSNVLSSRQ